MRLFTLLKEACYKLGLIADYVIETGTSGIWTYRKWASGIAECWGYQNTDATFGASWGSAYLSTASGVTKVYSADYPTNLFNANPRVYLSAMKSGYLMTAIPAASSSSRVQYYMQSTERHSGNNIVGITIHILAKGTWGGVVLTNILRRWIPCGCSPC